MIEYLVEQQLTIAPRFSNNSHSNCSQFSADMNRPDISETEKQNEIQSIAKLKEMSIVSTCELIFEEQMRITSGKTIVSLWS